MARFLVKKASPGLDVEGVLAEMLGSDYAVEEFDPAVPLRDQVKAAHVLLVRSVPVTGDVVDAAPHLRLIQRPGAHVESVDVAYASRKRIPVCTIPVDMLGESYVGEHTMFLILALAKRFGETQQSLRNRRSGEPLTHGLRGKTLGLVGIGRTGTPVIRMAQAFGMVVIAVKRTVGEEARNALGLPWLQPLQQLPDLLRRSDFISIHVPMLPETTGLIGAREIALMKTTAFLINIARGPIVDKAALFSALQENRLAGAGLDVFWEEPPDPDDPLLRLPNVIATPHVAGFVIDNREEIARLTADNIKRVMAGLPAVGTVN